ncbi:MAG: PH domain-containing protein, partial [Bacteroidota bacterium]
IEGDVLSYKMGVLTGTVPIHKIWLIKKSTYPTTGNRPALNWNGLKIVYDKDRLIFVSPESEDTFIALLKQKNKAIEVML